MYDKWIGFCHIVSFYTGQGIDILFFRGANGNVKNFIAKAMFVLALLIGVPSIAMAHDGVTHAEPQASVQSSQQAVPADVAKSMNIEVKSVVLKSEPSAKSEKTASGTCPCGGSCAKCTCSMGSCCQFLNKAVALDIPVAGESQGVYSHEALVIGMTGETLSKPPQIS